MLKPIMKKINKEELEEKMNLEMGLSEWVSIQFYFDEVKDLDKEIEEEMVSDEGKIDYEANRYDAKYYDEEERKNISVYIYMDEHLSQLYAVDTVVQDLDNEDARYHISETPLAKLLKI